MNTLLTIKNLHASVGEKEILRGIALTVISQFHCHNVVYNWCKGTQNPTLLQKRYPTHHHTNQNIGYSTTMACLITRHAINNINPNA